MLADSSLAVVACGPCLISIEVADGASETAHHPSCLFSDGTEPIILFLRVCPARDGEASCEEIHAAQSHHWSELLYH